MTLVAVTAVGLVAGAWAWMRLTEEKARLDLTTYLLSIPADEWQDR